MKVQFLAAVATTSLTDGVYELAFADNPDEPDNYLVFQRGSKFDDQDRELGQDTYYVEVGGQDTAGYGGVKKIILGSTSIEFLLDPSTAWVENLESLEINFASTDHDHTQIKEALHNIFHSEQTDILEIT